MRSEYDSGDLDATSDHIMADNPQGKGGHLVPGRTEPNRVPRARCVWCKGGAGAGSHFWVPSALGTHLGSMSGPYCYVAHVRPLVHGGFDTARTREAPPSLPSPLQCHPLAWVLAHAAPHCVAILGVFAGVARGAGQTHLWPNAMIVSGPVRWYT